MGFFVKKSNTGTSSDWASIKSVWVKVATGWTAVKNLYVKGPGGGWISFWPKTGPYTFVSPQVSTDSAGTNTVGDAYMGSMPYPYLAASSTNVYTPRTLYYFSGSWTGNGTSITSFTGSIYAYPSSTATAGTYLKKLTLTAQSSGGTYSASGDPQQIQVDNTYDNSYVGYTVTALTNISGLQGQDTSDIYGRIHIIKHAPVNISAGSSGQNASNQIPLGTTISYSSSWQTAVGYAPDASKTIVEWWANSNYYSSGSSGADSVRNGGYSIKTDNPATSSSYSNTIPATDSAGNYSNKYLYIIETCTNSGGTTYQVTNAGLIVPTPPDNLSNLIVKSFNPAQGDGFFTTGNNTTSVSYNFSFPSTNMLPVFGSISTSNYTPYHVAQSLYSAFNNRGTYPPDTYSPSTTYHYASQVTYAGNNYIAINTNYNSNYTVDVGFSGIPPTNTSWWSLLGSANYYNPGDYVSYTSPSTQQTYTYICTYRTTGTYPTNSSYWQYNVSCQFNATPFNGAASGTTSSASGISVSPIVAGTAIQITSNNFTVSSITSSSASLAYYGDGGVTNANISISPSVTGFPLNGQGSYNSNLSLSPLSASTNYTVTANPYFYYAPSVIIYGTPISTPFTTLTPSPVQTSATSITPSSGTIAYPGYVYFSAGVYDNASTITTELITSTTLSNLTTPSTAQTLTALTAKSPHQVTVNEAASPANYYMTRDTVVGTDGKTYYFYSGYIQATKGTISTAPTYNSPVQTSGGWSATVSDIGSNSGGTFSATASAGSVSIGSSTGAITVTGLSAGQSSTVTVTYTVSGYNPATISVTGNAISNLTAPTITSVSGSAGNVSVSFSGGSGPYYQVTWYSTNTYNNTSYDASGSSSPITVTDLVFPQGNTWYFYVRSVSSTSNTGTGPSTTISSWSSPVSWVAPQYTVTWNANGGSVTTSSSSAYSGSSVTAPTPTRSNYTFNGWYSSSSGGSLVVSAGGSYTPTASVTLYAQWTYVFPAPTQTTAPSLSSSNGGYVGSSLTATGGSYTNTSSVTTLIAYNSSGSFSGSPVLTHASPYTITALDASGSPYYFATVDTVVGLNGSTYYYYSSSIKSIPAPSTPVISIYGYGDSSHISTSGFTVSSTNATSISWTLYRTATGTGTTGYGTGTYSSVATGTINGSSGNVFIYLAYGNFNGYYYLAATGTNGSGSSAINSRFPASGVRNWMYY